MAGGEGGGHKARGEGGGHKAVMYGVRMHAKFGTCGGASLGGKWQKIGSLVRLDAMPWAH